MIIHKFQDTGRRGGLDGAVEMDLKESLGKSFDHREEVWDFIREFASRWASPLLNGDGWSDNDLDEAEHRLLVNLPTALREAYSLFGRRADLTKNQDRLLDPKQLRIDDEHEALVFRDENQGAASWGILLCDIHKGTPDPPVYIRQDMGDKSLERWELWEKRFSLDCLGNVLWEAMHDSRAPTDYADWATHQDNDLGDVGQSYPELVLIDLSYFRGARWFATAEVLILADDSGVFLRARGEEELTLVYDKLPALSHNWLRGLDVHCREPS